MAVGLHKKWEAGDAVAAIFEEEGPLLDLTRDPDVLMRHGLPSPRSAVRAGWLRPLERRGLYEVVATPAWKHVDELALVPALVGTHDYYVSWWSALALHGLTEQLPSSIWIAVKDIFRPARVIGGTTYRFVRLSDRKFFGVYPHRVGRRVVMVATCAKAVVDSVDHPEYAGGMGEVAKAVLSPRVATADLIVAAQRHDVRAVAQRLGWLIENARRNNADGLRSLRNRGSPYLLDPAGQPTGDIDPRWNVVVNLDAESLREQLRT